MERWRREVARGRCEVGGSQLEKALITMIMSRSTKLFSTKRFFTVKWKELIVSLINFVKDKIQKRRTIEISI